MKGALFERAACPRPAQASASGAGGLAGRGNAVRAVRTPGCVCRHERSVVCQVVLFKKSGTPSRYKNGGGGVWCVCW